MRRRNLPERRHCESGALAMASKLLCLVRRHRHWERETLLIALASGRSARCGTCNRLVLKKEFRRLTRNPPQPEGSQP